MYIFASDYDPRLKELVARAEDTSLFRNMDIPYSTLRNWARKGKDNMMVCDLLDSNKADLVIKNLKITLQYKAVKAQLNLVLTTMKIFGFTIDWKRLPSANAKTKLLEAIEKARQVMQLTACLDIIGLSSSRFHSWVKRQKQCRLEDYKTCPKSMPTKLTHKEQDTIKELYLSKEHAHFSIRALALYALIMGYVCCSPSTWYRTIKENEWRRPRKRVYPEKKRIGIRKDAPNKLYHLDITIIKLVDGTKIYIQILLDNYSRYVLAWSISKEYGGQSTAALLRCGARRAKELGHDWPCPEVFTDGGPENDNEWMDHLVEIGFIIRTFALTESKFSNSLVEALNRSLKVNCLYNHPLDTYADVKRLVNFYMNQHCYVMPHSAFNGATPFQMYIGSWTKAKEQELKQKLETAKIKRREYRLSLSCANCR